jgi:hypothetical protein
MCIITEIFTAAELRGLGRKSRDTLTKLGIRLVRTSPAIRKIIKKDPRIQKKLKPMLRPKLRQLMSKRK